MKYYKYALKIDRNTGNTQDEVKDLGNIAITYRKIGKSNKAQKYQEEADKIKREIEIP